MSTATTLCSCAGSCSTARGVTPRTSSPRWPNRSRRKRLTRSACFSRCAARSVSYNVARAIRRGGRARPSFFFFFVLSFGVYIFPFFLPFPSFSLPSLLSFFSYFLPSFLSSLFFSYVTFLSVLLQLSVLSVLSCILLGLDSAPRLCVLSLLLPAHSRKTLPHLSSSIPPPPSHSRRTARVLISVKHDTAKI